MITGFATQNNVARTGSPDVRNSRYPTPMNTTPLTIIKTQIVVTTLAPPAHAANAWTTVATGPYTERCPPHTPPTPSPSPPTTPRNPHRPARRRTPPPPPPPARPPRPRPPARPTPPPPPAPPPGPRPARRSPAGPGRASRPLCHRGHSPIGGPGRAPTGPATAAPPGLGTLGCLHYRSAALA